MSEKDILYKTLEERPVVYVTRDIERAGDLYLSYPNYYILTNTSDEDYPILGANKNIISIRTERKIDTHDILNHKDAKRFLKSLKNPFILVFKNTSLIEKAVREIGLTLLNPSSDISNKAEEKNTQSTWLRDSARFLPENTNTALKNISWGKEPFIIQFNHSHSGEGTLLVQNQSELKDLQKKFPNREVRKSVYIKGPSFTTNGLVTESGILVGNISFQITGLPPFTDLPFSTVGNDWGLPKKILSKEQISEINKIVTEVGNRFKEEGYKGLFGIDVVVDENTRSIYLIEVNARQTANIAFESKLQKISNTNSPSILEAQLMSLLDIPLEHKNLPEIRNGGQIIQRLTNTWKEFMPSLDTDNLIKSDFSVFVKKEEKHNSNIMQIQSKDSIMEDTSSLNEVGKKIEELLPIHDITKKTLSKEALEMISSYKNLPIAEGIVCPYFNNKRGNTRGGLRGVVGKGTIDDLKEEIDLLFSRKRIDPKKIDKDSALKMLVEDRIGIDCSGFVFHILNSESQKRKKGSLRSHITFPQKKSLIRGIIMKLRAVQNTDVKVFTSEKNSKEIKLGEIKPGDFISMTHENPKEREYDHIVLIKDVYYQNGTPLKIIYSHSIHWPSDGQYNHGVRDGVIKVTDIEKPIEDQKWIEKEKEGEENYTHQRAKKATTSVRRFNWF